MTDKMKEREQSYEAKYKHDQELAFRARSRGNRFAGLWAAELMGLSGDEAAAYASDIVLAGMEREGESGVVARLLEDLAAHGTTMTEAAVAAELARCHARARQELEHEHPRSLGPDHGPVGG